MKLNLISAIVMIFMVSCQQTPYERLVDEELQKGVRLDSLILGIGFGDTRKDFFSKCWAMNKRGKIFHGPDNKNVRYNLQNGEGLDVRLLFYPEFDNEDRIKKMNMSFSYDGWTEWNEETRPFNLLPMVKDTLVAWYGGNDFMHLKYKEGIQNIYVKVDGNRRIALHTEHKRDVVVVITDLLNEENK